MGVKHLPCCSLAIGGTVRAGRVEAVMGAGSRGLAHYRTAAGRVFAKRTKNDKHFKISDEIGCSPTFSATPRPVW